MPLFAYVRSLRGPTPQAIVQELRGCDGEMVGSANILQVHIVTEHEAKLPLNDLSYLYPYKER